MKSYKIIYFFALFVAISFLVGCPSAANVQNSPAANAASNQTGSGSAPNKNTVSTEEKPKPADTAAKIETVYVDLTGNKCKTTDSNEEEGWSVQLCEGVGGYKLEVTDGDLRQTINVIAPNGKKSELDFQANVSGAFSAIGDKAEWRVEKKDGKVVPIAMIVRLNANDKKDETKTNSYLVVSKITPERSCITDVVKPIANANEEARKLADSSANKPCMVK